MRTPARAERDLVARLLAPIGIAAALCLLFATLFAGCEGPGLEPPVHDRNNGMGPSAGGTLPPPVMTGGNGGSFGNAGQTGSAGNAGGSGAQSGGAGGQAGGNAGSSPDSMSEPDGGTTVPGFDAGADEDAGVD